MIELNEVTKSYLGKTAVKNISLQLTPGRVIGVIGENGSGKSTMLKMIAGLTQPTGGVIRVDGEPVSRRSARIVSYLSELDVYYSYYTVGQTIAFFATQFADFDTEKAYEVLRFMKLNPDQKVKHLSKGNRGRLKIVLTLARKAPVILMDEPLSGLDPMVRDSIVKGLISFIDMEKQTVVITTHEVSEIEPLLDEVVAIRAGRIIKTANVEDLRKEENSSIVEWMKRAYEQA